MNDTQHADDVFLADIQRRITEAQSQTDAQQRAELLNVLCSELREHRGAYREPPLMNRFHRLWRRAAQTDEQHLAVLVSWRSWYAIEVARIDAGLYANDDNAIDFIAETKASLAEIDSELANVRTSMNDRERQGHPTAAPLLLDVPLTTLARCLEAMRRSRFIKPTEPTAAIVSHLWSTRSNAKNREVAYNATRANLRASQANDERITALILALAYDMPPEQIQELATAFTGITRGQTPPAWSQYTK